jgi:hypothetical protein
MKILIALVALVALVGMAAAEDFPDWKITGKLSYSYQETVVADEASVAGSGTMNSVNSHAAFAMPSLPVASSPGGTANAGGFVKNTLTSGTFGAVSQCDDPITQTLTQTGNANLVFEKVAEKDTDTYTMDGYLFKAQEYDVKGQINYVGAQFADIGIIGENYYGPFAGAPLQSCGNLWAKEDSTAYGSVQPVGTAWFKEGWVGTSSSTRVTMKVVDDITGCQLSTGPLLSGSSDAYAGFTDATIGQRDVAPTGSYIQTQGVVTTQHWLENTENTPPHA